jgi:hypothetical protein
MTMSMIERVAAALEDVQLFINTVGTEEVQICRREKDGGHSVVSRHPYDADGVVELRAAVRRETAKAAIEAMREPTLTMRQAGAFRWRLVELSNGSSVEVPGFGDHPITSYGKMIDAALIERGE